MRVILALLLMIHSNLSDSEIEYQTPWDAALFGAPCTLNTDILEGTCDIVLRPIKWK